MYTTFGEADLSKICDGLAERDLDLKIILEQFGYPPFWSRPPGFETLVYIILEQQVSLASAKAAMEKLQQKIGIVTPRNLIALSDAELKACYFSRQKIVYARQLSDAVLTGRLNLEDLATEPDDVVRNELLKNKGIGHWTVDVYLMMALHRTDCFPAGDVALISSLKATKHLGATVSKEEAMVIAGQWKPYRTIASFLLWHAYLSKKKKSY